MKNINKLLFLSLIAFAITILFTKSSLAVSPNMTISPTVKAQSVRQNTKKTPTQTPKPTLKATGKVLGNASPSGTLVPSKNPQPSFPTKSVTQSAKKPAPSPTLFPIVRSSGQVPAASVVSVKGQIISVSKDNKLYKVRLLPSTLFRQRYWGMSDVKNIAVNDKVNITGTFLNKEKTVIEATLVRNLSIMKRRGVTFAIVTKVSASSLIVKPKDYAEQSVSVLSSTSIVDKADVTTNLTTFKVGDRVRIKGLEDRGVNTITEVTQIKNFSLPRVNNQRGVTQ